MLTKAVAAQDDEAYALSPDLSTNKQVKYSTLYSI
jgi:hypothetical protein